MKFDKVINEVNVDTGEAGHFVDRMSDEEREKFEKENKGEKRKRSRKRVFGSWFTNHNNSKHLTK